jgi:hypothetical protein
MAEHTIQAEDMQMLESSWHFVPSGRIPDVDANLSFRKVYEQLKGEQGAFFVTHDGQRRHFVRARMLAEHVLREARQSLALPVDAGSEARDEAIRQAVAAICEQPIGDIVENVWRESPVLPIQKMPVGANESRLRAFPDGVFDMVKADEHLGWYLNHETVQNATTDKTIFVCTNPSDPHKNISPDSGTCSRCPFPINRAKSAFEP